MQRINLSVDLDENELFDKSLSTIIENAVKSKAREIFDSELNKIIDKQIEKKAETFENNMKYGYNPASKLLNERIDNVFQDKIKNLTITEEDISNRIDNLINKKLQNVDIKKHIDAIVNAKVEALVNEKILQLLRTQ